MKAKTDSLASQIALISTFATFFAKELGCKHPEELEIEITYLEY